ncbi:transcriptional regulator [Streptomyces sp. NBC_01549]|uniref:transcriptional regulator n=1 Tax=Streptomyces sp. NBC_01549 TaxID=2975874 RepID=UPI0022578B40|nr:transcriptional regulator [Streptomyces sp. NBC_01549]MCX4598737.1 transcriptional regulator [Streptomyces sp. NBC_01549]
MHIPAKADYATRALLELAREPARPLTCEAIASSQQIPFRFVNHPSLKRRAQELNFFSKRARCPRFKSKRKSRASAQYTGSAFTFRDGRSKLAKMAGPLVRVDAVRRPDGEAARGHRCGGRDRRRPGPPADPVDR